jgi:MFS family permease
MWLVFILIGLAGQFAWAIENMYLNTYITFLNFHDPSGVGFDYSHLIAITTAASAVVATLTTIFMGGLTDKIGHRKAFISYGYIIWGISTAAFGLCNIGAPKQIIPIAMSASTAAIVVVVLDCVMTFFGSTANDASFNSFVTSSTDNENRGKVEGVLSILPLVAMLIIFVGLNGLTTKDMNYQWDLFFYIVGGFVAVIGVVGLFLIPKDTRKETAKESFWALLIEGFKPSTIKKNKFLYLTLLTYFIYAVATQVYFPYLMIYIEKSCSISNTSASGLTPFAMVMAIALLGGSVLSVLLGFLSDKLGKEKMIVPSISILLAGLILLFFVPSISDDGKRTIFCAIAGLVMILGYVGVPTIINAIVRQYIPKGKEGTFMGVRMIFVVAAPMCIGPFIGDALSKTSGMTYTESETGITANVPSKWGYIVAGAILLLALIPVFFLIKNDKIEKDRNNAGKQYMDIDPKDIDFTAVPLSEYPRPNFVRSSYICLNGAWDCAITESDKIPEKFDKQIVVPYAVESPLSGINHMLKPSEYIWYRRKITVPASFNKGRVFLNFDGVDQHAWVYLDGTLIGEHEGGYTKFSIELPAKLTRTFTLQVCVKDVTDSSYHATGKQRLNPNGWFYTSSSGIYKTVWLESTPKEYIKQIKFSPDFDNKAVLVEIISDSNDEAKVTIEGKPHLIKTNTVSAIKLIDFKPWSPEEPCLYKVEAKLKADTVSSYFGLRKVVVVAGEAEKPYIEMNGKKLILNGLLDQGYYFLGNLTPRSYSDYLDDIIKAKRLGFNTLRVHVKIEDDMFYYYADKYGMLLIQDFPNGGRHYIFRNVVIPRLFPCFNHSKFISYKKLSRTDEAGREEFLNDANTYMEELHNYPSIIIYTIFNEGWGEFDPEETFISLRRKEHMHLFDTASGWYDSESSDLYSIHAYILTHQRRQAKDGVRPYVLTEIGGASLFVKDHFFFEKVYGHSVCKKPKDLQKKYLHLYEKDIIPLMKKGDLNGAIYTQFNDCETECNGLFTFDRQVLKINEEAIKKVNSEIAGLTAPAQAKTGEEKKPEAKKS